MNNYTTYTTTTDGGGFMGGDTSASQGPNRSRYDEETLRPITIKQLYDATQDSPDSNYWQLDGEDLYQVTIVGRVQALTKQPTNIIYQIDDGTGIIEVKRWIDTDKANQMEIDSELGGGGNNPKQVQMTPYEKPVVEDGFVRAWGRIKSFGNKKHLGAHMVKPIENFNEFNYHLLEATYVHLSLLQKSGGGGVGGMFVDSYSMGGQVGHTAQYGGDGNDFSGNLNWKGMPVPAQKVCNYLKNADSSNEGMHLNTIAQGTGLTVREVLEATDQCVAAGHIYTTIDDEHWALLEF